MSKKNDGGPAFPIPGHANPGLLKSAKSVPGMSLRAWLAGQALVGLIGPEDVSEAVVIMNSRLAVLYADAMLAELEKE